MARIMNKKHGSTNTNPIVLQHGLHHGNKKGWYHSFSSRISIFCCYCCRRCCGKRSTMIWQLRLIVLSMIGLTLWTFSMTTTTTTTTTTTPYTTNKDINTDRPTVRTTTSAGATGATTTTSSVITNTTIDGVDNTRDKKFPSSSFSSSSSLSSCQPTHQACKGYNGVYHIQSGDYGGASGTIFFQFVVAQLVYAEQYNLLPFVYLNNFSHLIYDNHVHGGSGGGTAGSSSISFDLLDGVQVSTIQDPRWHRALYPGPPERQHDDDDTTTSRQPQQQQQRHHRRRTYTIHGDGVWTHYFQPVSDYCPTDKSCLGEIVNDKDNKNDEDNSRPTMLPYLTMEPAQISPGLHLYTPWAPKIWRYGPLPAFIAQPHIKSVTQWLTPQRLKAHEIVQKYFHFQPWIEEQSQITTVSSSSTSYCLGLHVRWSDKGASRRKLGLEEFAPFVKAYMEQFIDPVTNDKNKSNQRKPCIYLATDAEQVIQFVTTHWPQSYQDILITSRATIRSPNETAVFDLGSHHDTNTEVLLDILDLSHCEFLLHGNSAVSEAAIYMNGNLIYQSVNLEDPYHGWTPQSFGTLVKAVMNGTIGTEYWKTTYRRPKEWWEVPEQEFQMKESTRRSICLHGGETMDGHVDNEILNITLDLFPTQTTVRPNWSLSMNKLTTRLFVDLVNQLYHAKYHNLRPRLDDNFMLWRTWFESLPDTSSEECINQDSTVRNVKNVTDKVTVVRPSMRFFQKLSNKKQIISNTSTTTTTTVAISPNDITFQTWFQAIRQNASTMLHAVLKFRPYLVEQADQVFTSSSDKNSQRNVHNRSLCLGLHIPDPGYKRNTKLKQWVRKSYPQTIYQAYVNAYQQAGGTCIYLSTDSHSIWVEWTEANTTTGEGNMYFTQRNVVRNRDNIPMHYMEENVNRLVSETLVDVWNLASCGILIHGSHPLSDAALFWNADHLHSFHVQDSKKEVLSVRLEELKELVAAAQ